MNVLVKSLLLFAIVVITSIVTYWCLKTDNTDRLFYERPTITQQMDAGCVLIAPYHEYHAEESKPQNIPRVFLVNKRTKKVLKSWSNEHPVTTAKIDHKGNLWILTNLLWSYISPVEIKSLNLDSRSENVISLPNIRMDFDFTPNGILFTQFDLRPNHKSGRSEAFKFDRIVEMDPSNKKIIWEYDFQKMMPEAFAETNKQQYNSRDMTHVNSVRYVEKNPITQTPAVLVIVRNISQVLLIEKESKKILWMSKGQSEFPHDARLLENGNLMLFNNRGHSIFSSVEQWDISSGKLVWEYRSHTESELQSSVFGSAQRLKNGNTLITEGVRGHVFEVSPQSEVVWEYYQTFDFNDRRASWPIAPLFRVDQYDPEFIKKLGWGDICS